MRDSQLLIYLDHNATTPVLPAVLEAMLRFLSTNYGNPSSAHVLGMEAREAIEAARAHVAALVDCDVSEVIFNSSATEAINTALHSAISETDRRGRVVTTAVEHSAVMNYCTHLEKRGYDVARVGVGPTGELDWEAFELALQPGTLLVSVMWANNETGVVFPIERISRLCRERDVLLHVDAVQAAGKLPISLESIDVDYLSFSAHKMYGPKGAGALIVRNHAPYQCLHHGGHQESGRRGGTENVASIVGFGEAARLARAELEARSRQTENLRDRLERDVLSAVPQAYINGDRCNRVPNTTNIGFPGIDSDALVAALNAEGICVSAGSACLADSIVPSHVIMAMSRSYAKASEAVRFSLSHLNTAEELDRTVAALVRVLERIRPAASGSA